VLVDILASYGLDSTGFESGQGKAILSFSKLSTQTVGHT
jgi:hypothetical protein